jgi:hypothetical protein
MRYQEGNQTFGSTVKWRGNQIDHLYFLALNVNRENILNSAIIAFTNVSQATLMQGLDVSFIGEESTDGGKIRFFMKN